MKRSSLTAHLEPYFKEEIKKVMEPHETQQAFFREALRREIIRRILK